MNTAKLITLGLLRGSGAADTSASFTATTTGAETLTIAALTVSAATTVDWGDGSSNAYTGAGARTHDYAGAGTWTVRIMEPLNVTVLTMSDAKITVTSAGVRAMANMLQFYLSAISVGVFATSDLTAWRPTLFRLFNIASSGFAISSADMTTWTPSTLRFEFLSGGTFAFDLTDINGTNLQDIAVNSSPVSAVIQSDVSGWGKVYGVRLIAAGLSQSSVDNVLLGIYTSTTGAGTSGGGVIDLSGAGNAAPSGVYAATCPPLTGWAAVYELLNDSCGSIAPGREWVVITLEGGLP